MPHEVKSTSDGVILNYKIDEKEKSIQVEYVLSATGRSSLLDTLKLENIDKSFKDIKLLPINAKTKQLDNYPILLLVMRTPLRLYNMKLPMKAKSCS